MQIAGLPAGAGVFLGAFARVARAIFTLTIGIAALIGFFTHTMSSVRLYLRLLKNISQ